MKHSHKWILIGLLVLGSYALSATAMGQPVISLGGVYVLPSDDEIWDDAYGIEARLIMWTSDHVGFAAAAGYQQWGATKKSLGTVRLLGGGSADFIPLGGSVLFRGDLGTFASFMAELGARYVLVDADLSVYYARADFAGGGFVITEGEDKLSVDDAIIGLIGIDLVLNNLPVFVGAGYQFDIDQSEAKLGIARFSRDVELEGFFIRAGIAW